MDEAYLYQQIAEAIRSDILQGRLKPGDRLPSVRQLRKDWNCTPGTVQRAYSDLAREGLVVSQAGRGTQVAGNIPIAKSQAQSTLRTVGLVHRSEAFLLEVLTAGYNLIEIQSALDLAMDRWRVINQPVPEPPREVLHFIGSHDLLINGLAHHYFGEIDIETSLQVSFSGSSGGLAALAEGRVDLAGCHMWDPRSDTYNIPYIQRMLPGKEVTVLTLAHRCLGLILAPGNPLQIQGLADLARPEVRFVNRQTGSGTRIWLDAMLEQLRISHRQIQGYRDERMTHTDVARAVAEGSADAGIGLEIAALAYGLDFTPLAKERYDLVMLQETARRDSLQRFIAWLRGETGKSFVEQFKGYDASNTGMVQVLR